MLKHMHVREVCCVLIAFVLLRRSCICGTSENALLVMVALSVHCCMRPRYCMSLILPVWCRQATVAVAGKAMLHDGKAAYA
jgi:hypothetical protein